MEEHIEPKVVMLAAEHIREKGTQLDGKHCYQQLNLEISYDGYTIIISDSKVRITLFFHNKIKVDYQRAMDVENLYQRLKQLAQE